MTPDYLATIGGTYYTAASFAAEAAQYGVSRRLAHIPADLVVGQSRVYCLFGTGHDSAPAKCIKCKVPMPRPQRGAHGDPATTCPTCGRVYVGRKRGMGTLPYYFVPQAVEVVLRVTNAATQAIVQGYRDLGLLDAQLQSGPDMLRATCTVQSEQARDILTAIASCAGVAIDADLLAPVVALPGARIALVAAEPVRGCGTRKHGGSYLVTGGGTLTPLQTIAPPIAYDGAHFRGMKVLTHAEAVEARAHTAGTTTCTLPHAPAQLSLLAA